MHVPISVHLSFIRSNKHTCIYKKKRKTKKWYFISTHWIHLNANIIIFILHNLWTEWKDHTVHANGQLTYLIIIHWVVRISNTSYLSIVETQSALLCCHCSLFEKNSQWESIYTIMIFLYIWNVFNGRVVLLA